LDSLLYVLKYLHNDSYTSAIPEEVSHYEIALG
jgi:hypothetical protein